MKILFISGREPAYVRNAIILKALQKNGVEIIDCTSSSATYLTRYFKVLSKFIFRRDDDINAVFVGFFGQPLVPIIKKLTGKPIVFDAFLSAYDTMCFDRKKFKPDSYAGSFFYWLDKYSCEQSDRILLDTNAHIDYFLKTFGLPKEKFHRVFVGADESLFYPRDIRRDDRRFRVFYYSSFLPLHGTEYIVQAASRLHDEREIEFLVAGKGPEHQKVRDLAQKMGVANIRFIDWLPYESLPLEIANSDICLGGHFSDIEKAIRVIAGKTYQFIAMKKPVIVWNGSGNRELFTHKENAFLVKMADADSLANAILELKDNESLRKKIAEAGYKTFMEKCNTAAIGKELKSVIEALE
jgi:glycosyltransferase involved in cell wall biosynthesis